MTKLPAGVVIDGHIFLEIDQLISKVTACKKAAVKSYKKFYEKRIKEWVEDGDDVNIRYEKARMKETSNNIAMAIDTIIECIESIKEQA